MFILELLNQVTVFLSSQIAYLLMVCLVGTGLFVTVSLRFIQFNKLKHSLDVVRGKYDDVNDEGDVSHFQALSAALSATVGIGNIAGVALALRLGGPGALFWMWVTALLGMAVKYCECLLAHKYRVILPDGSAAGGPMYYIEKGLGKRWKPLAVFFAICAIICSFCTGNMNQSNSLANAMLSYGLPSWISGLLIASLVGVVIIGGIKRIAAVASKLVPTMALIYCVAVVVVMVNFSDNILPSLAMIFTEAFNLDAGWGALLMVIMWGIRRGIFSNEAGQGSAPIAHAAAKTKEPVREGVVALMEPFLDTLLICTMTGLAILSSGVLFTTDLTGVLLTQAAFNQGLDFFPNLGTLIISISVMLFGFSTAISWSYYGNRAVVYVFGSRYVKTYYYIYVAFVFLGAILPLEFVWNFGDLALSFMAIPNLIAIFLLINVIKSSTKDYFSRYS